MNLGNDTSFEAEMNKDISTSMDEPVHKRGADFQPILTVFASSNDQKTFLLYPISRVDKLKLHQRLHTGEADKDVS